MAEHDKNSRPETRPDVSVASKPDGAREGDLGSSNQRLLELNAQLQRSNQELARLNTELTKANAKLRSTRSDLQNLFDSTEIATLFLDRNLCVRRYTPAAKRLFGLKDGDVGRPVSQLEWSITYEQLDKDVAQLAADKQAIEREIFLDATGETFLMRLHPYRRSDNTIDGSVLTLVDVSERKSGERHLKENADTLARQYAELETLYETTPVGLSLLDRELRYLRINKRLAQINGHRVEDHIGRSQSDLIADIDTKIRDRQLHVLETGKASIGNEVRGYTPADPEIERFWTVDYYPVRTVEGEIFAVGSCVVEVTEQKRLQMDLEQALADLSESEERLEFALEAGQIGAWEYNLETEETERTPLHDAIFGHDEMLPNWDFERFLCYVVDADKAEVESIFAGAIQSRSSYEFQCRIRRNDGELRWIEARSRPRLAPSGELLGFAGTVADITENKEAQQQQLLLLHELQHRVKNTLATTLAIIRFSAKRAHSVPEFTETLSNRLQAIARTHDILTTQDWRGSKLQEIVSKELAPYAGGMSERVKHEGDNPTLSAEQMLALTLAFHELATNAAKYGALSVPDGKVVVSAKIGSGQMLDLGWRETGGPEVFPPDEKDTGFGSFLLKKVMGPDLEGTADIRYEKTGVIWTASFPLEHQD